jgi:hypothetical protein
MSRESEPGRPLAEVYGVDPSREALDVDPAQRGVDITATVKRVVENSVVLQPSTE